MAFKTAPSWDPGYALPGYVRAEGLQTRAFVTKWAPRGTYDDPNAFDPSWDHGYAVPAYINAEGYGQGARVTEWAPRGFYVGAQKTSQRIRANQKALGGDSTPAPFASYGARAAAAILVRTRALPPDQRKRALTKVLNAIDPALYGKAEQYSRQYQSAGASAPAAVELGLARAMSEGISKEVVEVGKRGRRPAPKGQLGLGCYGVVRPQGVLSGLGAITSKLSSAILSPSQTVAATGMTVSPVPGQCSADGLYIWKLTADGAGYWARKTSTDVCGNSGIVGPTSGGASGGITGGASTSGGTVGVPGATSPDYNPEVKFAKVGPFLFPVEQAFAKITWSSKLPADWQAEIARRIAPGGTLGSKGYQLDKFLDSPPTYFNGSVLNITKQPLSGPMAWQPIVKAKHPVSGKDYGVFLGLVSSDPSKTYSDPTNPPKLMIYWAEVKKDEPWYKDVWNAIKEVVVTVVDFAGEVLDTVSGIACNLLQSQAASAAGAAAAASEGVPPQTGAQGVQIAASSCGTPPPPVSESAGSDDWILPVAIGGGVVLAALLFLPKRKAK